MLQQTQRPGPETGVCLEHQPLQLTQIPERSHVTVHPDVKDSPDLLGWEQWMALILHQAGSGQPVLVTEGQQLSELSGAEVAHAQAAHRVPHVPGHRPVRLQPHVRTPVCGYFL